MFRFASAVTLPPPAPVQGRRAGLSDPLYTIALDEQRRIVRAATFGLWVYAEADEYVRHLAHFIIDSRERYGSARVLVDRRATPLQADEVADRFGRANRDLYRAQDKLALVVDSNIAKGQMRRRFVHAGSKAFLSYDAAETWLGLAP